MTTVTIGCDIGQKSDYSTVAIMETTEAGDNTAFTCRRLERLALGTPYPKVIDRIVEVVDNVGERLAAEETEMHPHWERIAEADRPLTYTLRLYVDGTGVGQPVIDLLRERLRGKRVVFVPCVFVWSNQSVLDGQTRWLKVGKANMVARLQALLQFSRLRVPETETGKALITELRQFELKRTDKNNDIFGAFQTGAHDDLVTAVGLACLRDSYPTSGSTDYGRKSFTTGRKLFLR